MRNELQPATESGIRAYLRAYGSHSLAYSVMQHDLSFFEVAGVGGIAYRKFMGHTLALGNPLCAENDYEDVIQAFLRDRKGVIFAQVDGAASEALRNIGVHMTPVGTDAWIDLVDFNLSGRNKRDLRHYRNRVRSAGVEIAEIRDTPAERFELAQVSNRWIKTKHVSRRELSFLVRPFNQTPEPDTRMFSATSGSRLIGFVVFDPIYRDHKCVGYTASILRAVPDASKGTLDAVLLQAMDQFREEGIEFVSLGVMPMHKLRETAQEHGKGALPLYALCRIFEKLGWSPFVNVRGLCFHKSRYQPRTTPVFVATTSPIGLLPITILTRACGLVP
ncbi:MAG: DUF2156 domain-containing protein [Candidatus Hydrogenedentota bacterium]